MMAAVIPAIVLSGACAVKAVSVIELRDLPRHPVRDVEWVQNNRTAATMAMAIMEADVGIPRLEATLRFFADHDGVEMALVADGYDAAFAAQTAGRMDAIAGYRRVFFSDLALGRLSLPMRVGFISHELTHVLQYELGGGRRGTSDQWLREGFADWVASRVLAALDVMTVDDFRERRLREYRSVPGPLPGLEAMASFRQWVALASPAWQPAISGKAFLAVDFLIDRRGREAVIDYFARFARSEDRLGHFSAAFGQSLPAFEALFEEHLRQAR